MPVPCDCCKSTSDTRCALVSVRFDGGVVQTVGEAGWNVTNLAATADGITNTAALSGYTTGGAAHPSTVLRVEYTLSVQHSRVRGLRLWNQCGGDLNDADGLGAFTAEYYSGATLLATQSNVGGNGGAPFTFLLPGSTELTGVDRVVLRQLDTQGGVNGTKPLWRELQLLEFATVFPCRRRNGTLEWYSENGDLVAPGDVVDCATLQPPVPGPPAPAPVPFSVPDLHLLGGAFADAAGENLCNLVPAPSANAGWGAPSGGCYDSVSGTPTMDWTATTSLDFTYGGPLVSGGVFMHFSSPSLGAITWPQNLAQMTVGEQRWSNFFGGGRRARMTYVSGSACSMQMQGGTQLNVHFGCGIVVTNNRFLLEFFTP